MGSELNEQSCAEQWGHSMPWIPPFSLPASLPVELTQLTGTWQVLCETPHDTARLLLGSKNLSDCGQR